MPGPSLLGLALLALGALGIGLAGYDQLRAPRPRHPSYGVLLLSSGLGAEGVLFLFAPASGSAERLLLFLLAATFVLAGLVQLALARWR